MQEGQLEGQASGKAKGYGQCLGVCKRVGKLESKKVEIGEHPRGVGKVSKKSHFHG